MRITRDEKGRTGKGKTDVGPSVRQYYPHENPVVTEVPMTSGLTRFAGGVRVVTKRKGVEAGTYYNVQTQTGPERTLTDSITY